MGSRAALVVSAVPDNADSPMRLAQVVEHHHLLFRIGIQSVAV